MSKSRIFFVAFGLSLVSIAAWADSLANLAPREAIAIMPDGKIGRVVVTDDKAFADLLAVAKAIPWCAMLLKGEDGKVYLVNTDRHNPMVACEETAP